MGHHIHPPENIIKYLLVILNALEFVLLGVDPHVPQRGYLELREPDVAGLGLLELGDVEGLGLGGLSEERSTQKALKNYTSMNRRLLWMCILCTTRFEIVLMPKTER